MASRDAPFGLTEEELAQFEDVDLHDDEKEYVQASNEELEEEPDEEDEYNEAREADGPAEYAQRLPAWKIKEQAKDSHKQEKKPKMEEKTHEEEQKKQQEGKKTQDDGFEEVKLRHPVAAEPVDEEVIYWDAHSKTAQ